MALAIGQRGLVDFEPRHETPVLAERALGIALAIVTKTDEEGEEPPRHMLHAAWRLPSGVERLHVVAVDVRSGAVFHESIPLEKGASALVLDLARLFGLADDKTLGVFLWSGEHASPLRFVRHAPPVNFSRPLMGFDGEANDRWPQGDVELGSREGRLEGALHAPFTASAEPRFVTVLALSGDQLSSCRSRVPSSFASEAEWSFSVPIAEALPHARGRTQFVAVIEDMRSDVVSLDAKVTA